jgi:hypothetical protein
MRKTTILTLILALAATAWAAGPEHSTWRAADGAVYARGPAGAAVNWEWIDADGDGKPEVAVFRAGTRYSRVELDTNADGAADRVYLFDPDGEAEGFLDTDGDGVLNAPLGARDERQSALHEIGRGGALFKRALELRYAANQGTLPAIDLPAPALWPPFQRTAGQQLSFALNLTILPASDSDAAPRDVGRFRFTAAAGAGREIKRQVAIRLDPGSTGRPQPGVLQAQLYPVWVQRGDERELVVQLAGRLSTPGGLDEIFIFTESLPDKTTATLNVPIHDQAGRPAGQLLVELRWL